jgi:hypothetical protein
MDNTVYVKCPICGTLTEVRNPIEGMLDQCEHCKNQIVIRKVWVAEKP